MQSPWVRYRSARGASLLERDLIPRVSARLLSALGLADAASSA